MHFAILLWPPDFFQFCTFLYGRIRLTVAVNLVLLSQCMMSNKYYFLFLLPFYVCCILQVQNDYVFFGYFVVNCSVCCESWTRYQSSWQWSNVTRKLRRWCDTTVRTALRTFRANCHWRSESTGRFNVWTACFNLKGYSGQKCELS